MTVLIVLLHQFLRRLKKGNKILRQREKNHEELDFLRP